MTADLIQALQRLAAVELGQVQVTGQEPVMPSPFRIGTAAAATIGVATAAMATLKGQPGQASVDMRHAAVAFRSERLFRVGPDPIELWAPISGDYPSADGRVRIHANFDHHRDAALTAPRTSPDATREEVGEACARRTGREIEDAVTAAGRLRGRDARQDRVGRPPPGAGGGLPAAPHARPASRPAATGGGAARGRSHPGHRRAGREPLSGLTRR